MLKDGEEKEDKGGKEKGETEDDEITGDLNSSELDFLALISGSRHSYNTSDWAYTAGVIKTVPSHSFNQLYISHRTRVVGETVFRKSRVEQYRIKK